MPVKSLIAMISEIGKLQYHQ